MKVKKDIKEKIKDLKNDEEHIYKCEKCGYENPRTFLEIFEAKEYRYCLKCLHDFYQNNYPKALLMR